MPIRWRVTPVWEALAHMDSLLDQARPYLSQVAAVAESTAEQSALPGYVADRLSHVALEVERVERRLRGLVVSIREALPQEALRREHQAGQMSSLF